MLPLGTLGREIVVLPAKVGDLGLVFVLGQDAPVAMDGGLHEVGRARPRHGVEQERGEDGAEPGADDHVDTLPRQG